MMKIFVAILAVLLLCGCNDASQKTRERFRILREVTTYAKHDKEIVELTLPVGCIVIVVAEKVEGNERVALK